MSFTPLEEQRDFKKKYAKTQMRSRDYQKKKMSFCLKQNSFKAQNRFFIFNIVFQVHRLSFMFYFSSQEESCTAALLLEVLLLVFMKYVEKCASH